MAEVLQAVNDLTCSICVDSFRVPVTLHCGHSYCRECLQLYADQSRSTAKDDNDCTKTTELILSCPICRSPVNLGSKGVTGLPVNQELQENVRKSQSEGTDPQKNRAPWCSMCEGDEKLEAVKFCSTCGVLYCEQCLPVVHPMRGPLKRHQLISVDEYFASDTEPGSSKAEKSRFPQSCSQHNEPFSDFCFTCVELLCTSCVSSHNDHEMSDISSAYERRKEELGPKISVFQETRAKLMQCDTNISALRKDIQEKESLHIKELEKTINEAQLGLDNLLQNLTLPIKHRLGGCLLACDQARNDLKMHTDGLMDTVNKLTATDMMEFLQDSKELTSRGRIDKQLRAARDSLQVQEYLDQANRKALQLDIVCPKQICSMEIFRGKPLSTLVKRFTQADSEDVIVSQDNCRVESPSVARFLSNGKFLSGMHYWELDICINMGKVKSSPSLVMVGLSESGSWFPGKQSWGMKIEYGNHDCKCYNIGADKLCYQRQLSQFNPHRIGFHLDCEEKKLVIVDCNKNQVMCSLLDVKGPPFTPGIKVMCSGISVCIVQCDSSTIPQVLREILEQI